MNRVTLSLEVSDDGKAIIVLPSGERYRAGFRFEYHPRAALSASTALPPVLSICASAGDSFVLDHDPADLPSALQAVFRPVAEQDKSDGRLTPEQVVARWRAGQEVFVIGRNYWHEFVMRAAPFSDLSPEDAVAIASVRETGDQYFSDAKSARAALW